MAISQKKSQRKPTGGRYKKGFRKKKQNELGRLPSLTKVGAIRKTTIRGLGGNKKERIYATESVNLFDPKTKKCIKAKILTVKESPANMNYIRRNIMTKGSTIETDKGMAKITSRPGQDGTVNAVLISN